MRSKDIIFVEKLMSELFAVFFSTVDHTVDCHSLFPTTSRQKKNSCGGDYCTVLVQCLRFRTDSTVDTVLTQRPWKCNSACIQLFKENTIRQICWSCDLESNCRFKFLFWCVMWNKSAVQMWVVGGKLRREWWFCKKITVQRFERMIFEFISHLKSWTPQQISTERK
jgi:hypothetical protein